ncbi:MAG TPA: ABC transporter ATP-binding protein [Rubricoccaceae bacterium]|nr:ABC transporter ATP-binding protein [Rubricoccaceae bacterium]
MNAPLLTVHCLSKTFHDGTLPVVNGLSFEVEEGELFALLGPSGCGKTTALRLIAGFMRPDHGAIALAGRTLADDHTFVPPEKRGIGFVFQDYALFPHLTVAQNVAFGLRAMKKPARAARVREVLRMVGLDGLEDRLPHALSGGQQQRVALARALAPRPRLILLDEPFSNLDALFRQEMRDRVRDVLKAEGTTAVLVTHDQEEALLFADRVAVMHMGRIEQVGTPEALYLTPRTLFVAQFLGQTNLVLTEAHGDEVETVLGRLRLHRPAEGPVLVAVRPEHFAVTAVPDHPDCREAVVLHRAFRGHDVTYRVQMGGSGHGPVDCLVHTHNREPFAVGDTVYVRAVEPAVVLEKAGA